MEVASKRHGIDHEQPFLGQFEHDDLQKISRAVRANREDLGWVSVGFEVDPTEGAVECVAYVMFMDTMRTGRPVNVHLRIIV